MRNCARTTSPAFGRPSNAILSCSVRSSGAFDSATVIACANSSSASVVVVVISHCCLFNRKREAYKANKLIYLEKKKKKVLATGELGPGERIGLFLMFIFVLSFIFLVRCLVNFDYAFACARQSEEVILKVTVGLGGETFCGFCVCHGTTNIKWVFGIFEYTLRMLCIVYESVCVCRSCCETHDTHHSDDWMLWCNENICVNKIQLPEING